MSWTCNHEQGASVPVPQSLSSIRHAQPVQALCEEWWQFQPDTSARWPTHVGAIDPFTDMSLWPSGTTGSTRLNSDISTAPDSPSTCTISRVRAQDIRWIPS